MFDVKLLPLRLKVKLKILHTQFNNQEHKIQRERVYPTRLEEKEGTCRSKNYQLLW